MMTEYKTSTLAKHVIQRRDGSVADGFFIFKKCLLFPIRQKMRKKNTLILFVRKTDSFEKEDFATYVEKLIDGEDKY